MTSHDAELLTNLLEWIKNSSPPMAYQKKVRLDSLGVIGYEALLRATDGHATPIDPMVVLELASRFDLREEFEAATVRAVVAELVRNQCEEFILSVAVNLSVQTVQRKGFASEINNLLIRSGIRADQLVIELTEDDELTNPSLFRSEIQELHSYGIELSLDDFGSAYSGLERVTVVPFAEIKLNRNMISQLDAPRVASVIGMAKMLADRFSARLVAEGVETERQRQLLIQSGVLFGQGFLFGPLVDRLPQRV